jgi:hypothetical protein
VYGAYCWKHLDKELNKMQGTNNNVYMIQLVLYMVIFMAY